jgi:hypothetical protein
LLANSGITGTDIFHAENSGFCRQELGNCTPMPEWKRWTDSESLDSETPRSFPVSTCDVLEATMGFAQKFIHEEQLPS